MRRVASLVLPSLAIDRLRRSMTRPGGRPDQAEQARGAGPALAALAETGEAESDAACSCPRGGGWRPGARWAQAEAAAAGGAMREAGETAGSVRRALRDAEIAGLPAHQRPSPRELGRRSEAADNPFKGRFAPRPDAASALSAPAPAPAPAAPLVTARAERQRMVIAAACAAARALGLMPGMAITHGRALVPDLVVEPEDPAGDARLLARLATLAARRWTPIVQIDPPDGLLLDLTGVAHLHGGEERMARRILGLCARRGLEARIAIAGTVGAAHALARFRAAPLWLCPPQGEAAALAPLPIEALRIAPAERDAARRLGLERIGDLVAMPRAPLGRRFAAPLARLDQALGRSAEPIAALRPIEPVIAERRFAEPIAAAETIARVLAELVATLAERLCARGLGARLVRLVCQRVDRAEQTVHIGCARATREAAHLLRLLAMRIETIEPGYGIETMRLVVLRADPLAPVTAADLARAALAGGTGLAPDLAPLVDRIAVRLGPARLYTPSALESDVPERSVGRVAPLAEAVPWPTRWPRPARILRRPERLDHVLAGLPDEPPRRFVWRGVTHRVICADGPERITGEWWRRTAEAYAVRDYFRVENERGERFWLFRRGDGAHPGTGDLSWHIHGIFA
ncbi:Y-family DNA polymerase [Sphingomonas morindae]|uniref:DNA-directed DNA polymerase n=1 Tax=Sphingomonas morindae TaxID=1541170 RepID=A0ABY4XDK4_9SPHN|nr:DNA polymerase Y family protein [Sphingomonas morindae]USI75015.1 DNA polymerase Y family protein [Sphingomonas morindae]